MGKPLQKIWYQWMKWMCTLALRVYFRQWQVAGIEHVPAQGPVIFAVNHQNAFLDAVIVACSTPRNPHFLVRAGVFANRFFTWLLGTLQMMPIYRFRDGLGSVRKNDRIIAHSAHLLQHREALMIFPEGNHDLRWTLRPLQKGLGRILLAAEGIENFPLGVKVVPIGLHYEHHTAFRSRLLVNIGAPLDFSHVVDMDPKQALEQISSETEKALHARLVVVKDDEHYDETVAKWQACRGLHANMGDQWQSDKQCVEAIEAGKVLEEMPRETPGKHPFYLWPLVIWGVLNFFPAWITLRILLKTLVKDRHFLASMKFALGLVVVPGFLVGQGMIFYWLTTDVLYTGLYLISLVPSMLITGDLVEGK
jgi:1-acyl-sn-glycerol-3-phosphate acyltransferase